MSPAVESKNTGGSSWHPAYWLGGGVLSGGAAGPVLSIPFLHTCPWDMLCHWLVNPYSALHINTEPLMDPGGLAGLPWDLASSEESQKMIIFNL